MNINLNEIVETLIQDRLYIIQHKNGYRHSEDAIFLAKFIKSQQIPQNVLEIGAGNGVISLLLADHWPRTQIVAIEIQSGLVDVFKRSVRMNQLDDQITVYHADIRDKNHPFTNRKYDLIFANPPYYPLGKYRLPREEYDRIAHHEIMCTLDDVIKTAAQRLSESGSFFLIHINRRREEIVSKLDDNGFQIADSFQTAQRILFRSVRK